MYDYIKKVSLFRKITKIDEIFRMYLKPAECLNKFVCFVLFNIFGTCIDYIHEFI